MANGDKAVEDHVKGIRYGGKILSMIPAPEGWFVGTQVTHYNRETRETAPGTPRIFPLIAWAHVDAMFRDGERSARIEPVFVAESGSITHETEFRWREGAGDVDNEGWRTTVAVEVIPSPAAVANPPAYNPDEAAESADAKEKS